MTKIRMTPNRYTDASEKVSGMRTSAAAPATARSQRPPRPVEPFPEAGRSVPIMPWRKVPGGRLNTVTATMAPEASTSNAMTDAGDESGDFGDGAAGLETAAVGETANDVPAASWAALQGAEE